MYVNLIIFINRKINKINLALNSNRYLFEEDNLIVIKKIIEFLIKKYDNLLLIFIKKLIKNYLNLI